MSGMSDTDTLLDEDVDTSLDEPGDHDRFSHYVKKKGIMPPTNNMAKTLAL